MKRAIKLTAAALGTAGFMLVTAAGVLCRELPDTFYIGAGERLEINSPLPVTVQYHSQRAVEAGTADAPSQARLMLFGAVPIKEVSTLSVSRPKVVAGGEPIGLKVISDGVIVVDLQEVGGRSPAEEAGIEVGDVISKLDGETVCGNADVARVIEKSEGRPCTAQVERDGKQLDLTIEPELDGGSYKAGMWVRDSSAGIGTLTFYDRRTGAFAGLGHAVCDSDTGQPVGLFEGSVGEIKLTGITKSQPGSPGQLIGEFKNSSSIGEITENTTEGVYGRLDADPVKGRKELPIAFRQEVRTGEATVMCSVDGTGAKAYSALIEQTDISKDAQHDMVIRITDKRLLEKAGGIVQGMSGSPVIQDGRIVGAVTHVFVDDSACGYGIFADKMYEHTRSFGL